MATRHFLLLKNLSIQYLPFYRMFSITVSNKIKKIRFTLESIMITTNNSRIGYGRLSSPINGLCIWVGITLRMYQTKDENMAANCQPELHIGKLKIIEETLIKQIERLIWGR